MKAFKRIGAIVLTGAMTIGMSSMAFAADLGKSETGVAGTWEAPDTELVQAKSINIVKEIKSFNATSKTVYAPAYAYVYTVKPADVDGITVTDATTDHASGTAVTAPVKQGITAGLVVAGGNAGSDEAAAGTLAFTNATQLATSSEGATNKYDINIDFTNVSFGQSGVYRYEITESLADDATYAGIDVKAGNGTATKVRYLDVYVDGVGNIYGYVCMNTNGSVTPDTAKTNGFTAASDEAGNGADEYYTYDLTLSKDVVNDNYAESNTAFPFTVIFNNPEEFATTYAITEVVEGGSKGIDPSAAAPTWSGVAEVKEGGNITYTGIPAGVDVDVYETNIATGVTYAVNTKVNGDEIVTTDNNVTWGSKPGSAAAQTARADYESTKATINTAAITAVTAAQTLAITNTLLLISPTGVVLRFAPYAMMLAAGLSLLLVSRRRRRLAEEA